MARESENFRATYEILNEFFDEKKILNKNDVAKFLGKDKRTINQFVNFDSSGYISIFNLASALCKIGGS